MKELNDKLNQYVEWINNNPPHVLGCLSKKIDYERMLKLKKEIETKGWLPNPQALINNKNNPDSLNFFPRGFGSTGKHRGKK